MAERLRYVNTASTAGGDGTTNLTSGATRAYASASAWESASQVNLVSAGDTARVICEGATADTTKLDINGWTTGASNGITVEVTQANRHDGKKNTSKYRLSLSAHYYAPIEIREEYVRLIGLQLIQGMAQSDGGHGIYCLMGSTTGHIQIENCLVINEGGTTTIQGSCGIEFGSNDIRVNVSIRNSTFIAFRRGIVLNSSQSANITYRVYNNTVANSGLNGMDIGGYPASGFTNTIVKKNNLVYGSGTSDYAQDADVSRTTLVNTTNVSEDATSPNVGGRNRTFTFVDAGTLDFHLASGDTGATGQGTDLSADADWAFTDDIDGDTRSGSWSAGSDQYVAAGGTEFYETLSGSMVGVASMTTKVTRQRALSASAPCSPTMAKASTFKKGLSASAVGLATFSKASALTRTLSAAMAVAVTLTRSLTWIKALSASAVWVASLTSSSAITRTLSATLVGVASISRGLALKKTLAAALSGVASLSKGLTLAKTLSATMVGSVTLAKATQYLKSLSGAMVGAASLLKGSQQARTLSATAVGVPSLAKGSTFKRTLSATLAGVASLARAFTFKRTLSTTMTGIAGLANGNSFSQSLTATMVGVATLTRNLSFSRTLSALLAGVPTLSGLKTLHRTLSAATALTASLGRKLTLHLTLSAAAVLSGAISRGQGYAKALTATFSGAASIATSQRIGVQLAVQAVLTATLSKAMNLKRTLSASLAGVASISLHRSLHRSLSASMVGLTSLLSPRRVGVTLSAIGTFLVTMTRSVFLDVIQPEVISYTPAMTQVLTYTPAMTQVLSYQAVYDG